MDNKGSIFLIGPMGTGKSSTAKELEKMLPKLVLRRVDDIRFDFFRKHTDYSREVEKKIREQEGFKGVNRYWKQYEAQLIEAICASDDNHSIVDLGAGQTVYEDSKLREKVQRALGKKKNVFLLLPSEDIKECEEELKRRMNARNKGGVSTAEYETNEQFLKADDNSKLASHIIYTNGADINEVARTIAEVYSGKDITSDVVKVKKNEGRKKDTVEYV